MSLCSPKSAAAASRLDIPTASATSATSAPPDQELGAGDGAASGLHAKETLNGGHLSCGEIMKPMQNKETKGGCFGRSTFPTCEEHKLNNKQKLVTDGQNT